MLSVAHTVQVSKKRDRIIIVLGVVIVFIFQFVFPEVNYGKKSFSLSKKSNDGFASPITHTVLHVATSSSFL